MDRSDSVFVVRLTCRHIMMVRLLPALLVLGLASGQDVGPTDNEDCMLDYKLEIVVLADGTNSYAKLLPAASLLLSAEIMKLEARVKELKAAMVLFGDRTFQGCDADTGVYRRVCELTDAESFAKTVNGHLETICKAGDTPEASVDASIYAIANEFSSNTGGDGIIRILVFVTDAEGHVHGENNPAVSPDLEPPDNPEGEVIKGDERSYATIEQFKSIMDKSGVFFLAILTDHAIMPSSPWWNSTLANNLSQTQYKVVMFDAMSDAQLLAKLFAENVQSSGCEVIASPPVPGGDAKPQTDPPEAETTTSTPLEENKPPPPPPPPDESTSEPEPTENPPPPTEAPEEESSSTRIVAGGAPPHHNSHKGAIAGAAAGAGALAVAGAAALAARRSGPSSLDANFEEGESFTDDPAAREHAGAAASTDFA